MTGFTVANKKESGNVSFRSSRGRRGLHDSLFPLLFVFLVSGRRLSLCAGCLAFALDANGVEANQLLGLLLHMVDALFDLFALHAQQLVVQIQLGFQFLHLDAALFHEILADAALFVLPVCDEPLHISRKGVGPRDKSPVGALSGCVAKMPVIWY